MAHTWMGQGYGTCGMVSSACKCLRPARRRHDEKFSGCGKVWPRFPSLGAEMPQWRLLRDSAGIWGIFRKSSIFGPLGAEGSGSILGHRRAESTALIRTKKSARTDFCHFDLFRRKMVRKIADFRKIRKGVPKSEKWEAWWP